jgi:phosphatidylglycerophosphatase A
MQTPEKQPNRVEHSGGSRITIPIHIKIIGTFFFTGYAPIAPGTAGSLAALVPPALFPQMGIYGLLVLILIGFGAGIIASARIEDLLGDDPQIIVIDEAVGMWVTVLFVPLTPVWLITGFVLFRLFDVVKPYPIRSLEKYRHGWGVMLDDIGAGLYAGIALLILTYMFL